MSKRFKKFLKSAKKAAPVALPLLLGALSKKDVKLPPNPKMDAAVKGAQDALAENQRQIDLFNTPDAVRKMARDPRMINTNMRRIAELRRRGPIMRTVPMETMQEGGMVEAAQNIADKGRNGDSMLVHMSPEEVQGIASLGMVSINPETGLPEMFKFKDFLKIAVPIAITAMAPAAGAAAAAKGTAAANAATAAGTAPGFFAKAGQFLGTGIGKSLLTGAAQFAGQRLMGTDEKDALNAGIMAGATYGAASAAQKAFGPSQAQIAQTDAINKANIAKQQAYLDAIAPDQFITNTTPNYSDVGPVVPQQTVPRFSTENVPLIKEQFPTLAEGLRPGITQAELDAQRGIAQANLEAMQAPTDKFKIPGLGEVDKRDLYSGLGASAVGAMSVPPEVIEEEERKRKEIEMARPYSDPVTYPGAGYGSREYGYFGPNYGMYAKEGGHIKQMQEGGAVDTPASAFQGDLMAFAPGIVGGANYGMGVMPGGIDSSEFNYNVAPNMGGYDYRSFVPEDARGQGIASAQSVGTGEQVTGNPNVLEDIKKTTKSAGAGSFKPYTKWTSVSKLGMRANDPARSNRMFRDVVSGYTASGEPIYTRETKYRVAGTGFGHHMNTAKYVYGTMPIKFQEGGITSLPQTEGQVEGNGDGMSDEVYGDIENQQEVALSKDEFIVPADVVSSLGNGSSDAGADELYRMMERVRMAKSGKKTQPPEIDAEDYLPA